MTEYDSDDRRYPTLLHSPAFYVALLLGASFWVAVIWAILHRA